jgi:hypothetical protein
MNLLLLFAISILGMMIGAIKKNKLISIISIITCILSIVFICFLIFVLIPSM